MSETNKHCSNETVKQMIGGITTEMQNGNNQYVHLAFTNPQPSPPPTTDNWSQQSPQYYNLPNTDNQMVYHPTIEQFHHRQPPQPTTPYNTYIQQSPIHNRFHNNSDVYARQNLKEFPISDYNLYQRTMENGTTDLDEYDYHRLLLRENLLQAQQQQQSINDLIQNSPEPPHPTTHLIENLVGNWAIPNTSGTYSPFGSGSSNQFRSNHIRNMFQNEHRIDEQTHLLTNEILDDKNFPFANRNNLKKPRMIAEVKPMRPSYSDVLTKPVPQNPVLSTKPIKIGDFNNMKMKKDNNNTSKKGGKNDKKLQQKIGNNPLNRSNTNNDLITDKNTQFIMNNNNNNKINDKINNKTGKTAHLHQLNRKWASLDDINEPLNTNKIEEVKKKRNNEDLLIQNKNNKSNNNNNNRKSNTNNNKSNNNSIDSDTTQQNLNKSEPINLTKNGLKKGNNNIKVTGRQKQFDSFGNNNERPPGKRNQRYRKRENHLCYGLIGEKFKQYLYEWWKIFKVILLWLLHLISDICSLSVHITRDCAISSWSWICIHWVLFLDTSLTILKRIRIFTWILNKFNSNSSNSKKDETLKDNRTSFIHNGLQNNIDMPTTGDEAMRRLLACKGKDPYSILGVTPTCTDDDIKRYYKRQAFLVHPDKNQQPGAEEAFKILVHAFDMIGEPERRASYDKGVVESVQAEQAWSELSDLIAQLKQKVNTAANTIRCSACGLRHKRIKIDRPIFAARNCATCKIHHSAREGDIWAEARCFGFLWHYYACMEGGVYDITEWAGCQKDSLKQLRPDTHQVQYRIALGRHNNHQTHRHSGSPRTERPPDLENLLNSLYGQADSNSTQGTRRRNKKANK